MKFYSEKLDQLFDTPEALADAEKASKKKTKKATGMPMATPMAIPQRADCRALFSFPAPTF